MIRRQKGAISVEFALGSFAFILMFLFWIEVCYLGYVSSVVDLAISEASRDAKNREESDYKARFTQVLQSDNQLWGRFIDIDNLSMTTRYYNTVDELAVPCSTDDAGNCDEVGSASHSALAIYTLEYAYDPIFGNLLNVADGISLTREVIVVQEYERSEFFL